MRGEGGEGRSPRRREAGGCAELGPHASVHIMITVHVWVGYIIYMYVTENSEGTSEEGTRRRGIREGKWYELIWLQNEGGE